MLINEIYDAEGNIDQSQLTGDWKGRENEIDNIDVAKRLSGYNRGYVVAILNKVLNNSTFNIYEKRLIRKLLDIALNPKLNPDIGAVKWDIKMKPYSLDGQSTVGGIIGIIATEYPEYETPLRKFFKAPDRRGDYGNDDDAVVT